MLDPASALDACYLILRFLDHAAEVLEKTHGANQPNQLERERDELKELESARSTPDSAKQTDAERDVVKVYERCCALSEKLVPLLKSSNVEGINGLPKGKKNEDSEKVKKDAETLRVNCVASLLRLLNDRQSVSIRNLDEMRQHDAKMEAGVSVKYEKLRKQLLDALNSKQKEEKPPKPLHTMLLDMLKEAKHVKIAQEILLSLQFEGMQSRKHTISETHADTYEWIFSSPKQLLRQKGLKANFTGWLESGNGIFWVTGQPGSGKSTLMKFVDNHATTKDKLRTWATKYRLVKASHYFWVNGSAIQKSQAGLLRALCFQILRQCPDLLPQLCEERWVEGTAKQNHQQEWSVAELDRILNRLETSELKINDEQVRFCFFIDGLDEYSGDYEELLETLRQLSTSPHIKICAASRPWNLFEKALGQDESKMLTMQDLTHDDISTYVRDVVEEDKEFVAALKDNNRTQDLVDKVIERSNGVFLWVYLVLRSFRRSLANGESVDALEKNLGQFPSDLDDYFKHMLDTDDVFQQRETAQIFRVCIRARRPIALLAFAVLDPENPISHRLNGDEPLKQQDINDMHTKMQGQIELRGPDLLEVVQDGSYPHVTFTHRSVKDFLTHNNMDTLFEKRAGQDFLTGEEFEPVTALCRMTLLTYRRLGLITQSSSTKQIYQSLVEDLLDYAQDLEIAHSRVPFAELNIMEELLERDKDVASAFDTNKNSPLLPVAVQRNLCLFIKQRALNGPGTLQPVCTYPDRPLLSFSLPEFDLRSQKPPHFNLDMTKILLNNGSHPNATSWMKDDEAKVERRASAWSLFLRSLYSFYKRPTFRPESSSLAVLVTEAIIEAGAHYVPNCLTEDGNKGEKEILEYVFGKHEAGRLLSLRAQPGTPSVKFARTGSGTSQRPAWARSASTKLRRLSLSSGGAKSVNS